ncbi:IPTL-CTERM sorting domain-containing protein [Halomonas denitrificans]|nr:IPTL-CTERM sorting domain-containing protein [Halomonas denitrificans]
MNVFEISGRFTTALVALGLTAGLAHAQVTGEGSPEPRGGVPATDITFEPIDAPHAVCPPFGACPPADQVTDEYLGFGVDFTPFGGNPPVGVFNDPPEKFGGVNAAGDLDLVTDTCGQIVVPGTTNPGRTDVIGVAAGGVGGPSDILLEAFDAGGALVGSSIADDGADGDGDIIAVVSDPNGAIASFCVSTPTGDTHGVHFIYLNTPEAGLPQTTEVPSLSALGLGVLALLLAAAGLFGVRRFGKPS